MSSKSSRTTKTSPEDAGTRADLPERVAVGRVLRPHGVRGEVVVQVLSDVPGRLEPGSELLGTRLGTRDGNPAVTLTVETHREHKSGAVIRFAGWDDRDKAEGLRNLLLEVERSQVPAAPEGTYWWYQLLGCRCEVDGEDLGEVVDLVEDGGGLLLVVSDGEREVPIPFVRSFLKDVDVERGQIELELPEGLLEACASRS
jgi:16S rRNA processing protein RimM